MSELLYVTLHVDKQTALPPIQVTVDAVLQAISTPRENRVMTEADREGILNVWLDMSTLSVLELEQVMKELRQGLAALRLYGQKEVFDPVFIIGATLSTLELQHPEYREEFQRLSQANGGIIHPDYLPPHLMHKRSLPRYIGIASATLGIILALRGYSVDFSVFAPTHVDNALMNTRKIGEGLLRRFVLGCTNLGIEFPYINPTMLLLFKMMEEEEDLYHWATKHWGLDSGQRSTLGSITSYTSFPPFDTDLGMLRKVACPQLHAREMIIGALATIQKVTKDLEITRSENWAAAVRLTHYKRVAKLITLSNVQYVTDYYLGNIRREDLIDVLKVPSAALSAFMTVLDKYLILEIDGSEIFTDPGQLYRMRDAEEKVRSAIEFHLVAEEFVSKHLLRPSNLQKLIVIASAISLRRQSVMGAKSILKEVARGLELNDSTFTRMLNTMECVTVFLKIILGHEYTVPIALKEQALQGLAYLCLSDVHYDGL